VSTYPPGWGKAPKSRFKLNETHPEIEWSIKEISKFDSSRGRKDVRYEWAVANKVTGKKLHGMTPENWGVGSAKDAVTNAANYLLTHDLTWSKTEPCVICDQPSRVGVATCSHAHDLILEKVKQELADLPDAQ
jgi:hypothetical protein